MKINYLRGKLLGNYQEFIGFGVFLMVFTEIGGLNFFSSLWIILGLVIITGKDGIEFEPKAQFLKEYYQILWVNFGLWKSYHDFPFIAVLKSTEIRRHQSMYSAVETADRKVFYDIFLMDKSHRKKILIKRFKEEGDANLQSQQICKELGLEFTVYRPVISARTRRRRR